MAKDKKADLAIVFGGKPAKDGGESMPDEMDEGPGFEELAMELFPEKDPETLKAMIQACMDEGY